MFDINNNFEKLPQEPIPKITREQVIAAYEKFVKKGVTNPDCLDLEDPEVKEANELYNSWMDQEEKIIEEEQENNEEIALIKNIERNMLYVDAGFHDPEYLREVLGWLASDIEDAPIEKDNLLRQKTRNKMVTAIKKVRSLLEEKETNE